MTVKGKDVIGLKIVTVDTGSVIETVDDIAYNPNTQRVEALLVSSGGIFSSAKAVHMDDVRNIGEDAVVVPDASVVKSVKDLGDSVHSIADSNKHLVKTNVLTVDGKELGRVTDIFFDSSNGNVLSMEVTQSGLKTLTEGKKSIKPSDIVTIGADATIVSTYTEIALELQGEEGGLKGAMNDAKDKAAEVSSSVKESTQEAAETVKEKSQDLAENVKEKSAELRDTAQVKATEAREVIDEKSASAKVKAEELRDDAAIKSRELGDKIDVKAQELKVASKNTSEEVKIKADKLAQETKVKSQELREVTEQKAAETKVRVDELTDQAKERIEHVKDENARKSSAVRSEGRKVLEQTKEKLQDSDTSVEIEKTKIVKR